ncbi:hypothetical protein RND81_12G067800 [Saponaria officinalis]|uniref:Transmembrane protein n=1 Tax=Saponaria officinalis TaxID=3572 RepID=A0AAW1H7G8_SAPOF
MKVLKERLGFFIASTSFSPPLSLQTSMAVQKCVVSETSRLTNFLVLCCNSIPRKRDQTYIRSCCFVVVVGCVLLVDVVTPLLTVGVVDVVTPLLTVGVVVL